jgi:phosphatidylglycerophosphatase A
MVSPDSLNPPDPLQPLEEAAEATLADAALPSAVRVAPWRHGPNVWLATGFWVGFVPFAPGTFGTLLGIPLAWALSPLAPPWHALILVALSALGIPICTAAAARLKLKDPGCVVYDEFISLAWAFFLVPLNPITIVVGFLLHRVFDILKPPPIRQLERLPRGWGIMADDLAAGALTNLLLQLLVWWWARLPGG